MPNERLARHILLAKPTGKQPRGLPRTTWSDCIAWYRLGVGPAELSEIAVHREVFQVRLPSLEEKRA